jgi:hypothetical protein
LPGHFDLGRLHHGAAQAAEAPDSVNEGHETKGRLDLGLDSLHRDFFD